MRLRLGAASLFEGEQLFSLTYTCDECLSKCLVYLGPAISLPLGQELGKLLIQAEDGHNCAARGYVPDPADQMGPIFDRPDLEYGMPPSPAAQRETPRTS